MWRVVPQQYTGGHVSAGSGLKFLLYTLTTIHWGIGSEAIFSRMSHYSARQSTSNPSGSEDGTKRDGVIAGSSQNCATGEVGGELPSAWVLGGCPATACQPARNQIGAMRENGELLAEEALLQQLTKDMDLPSKVGEQSLLSIGVSHSCTSSNSSSNEH